jgi:hypothetical protein
MFVRIMAAAFALACAATGRGADRTVFGAAYGAFSMDQAAVQKATGVPPQYYELVL